MQAVKEIGLKRTFRFFYLTLLHALFRCSLFPPIRRWFLICLGAKVGHDVVMNRIRFFNYDRKGFRGLKIGNHVFIGDECLLDLAEGIELADHVTLAERVTVLTHINVGYKDHPLQKKFPSKTEPVRLGRGCFIGACSTILAGIHIGEESLIGAGSLVNKDIPAKTVVAGVPAKKIREI